MVGLVAGEDSIYLFGSLTRRFLPPTASVSTTAAGRAGRPAPTVASGRANRCGVSLDGVAAGGAVGRRIEVAIGVALVADPMTVPLRSVPCASSLRMFRLTGLLGVMPAVETVCMRAFLVVDRGLLQQIESF